MSAERRPTPSSWWYSGSQPSCITTRGLPSHPGARHDGEALHLHSYGSVYILSRTSCHSTWVLLGWGAWGEVELPLEWLTFTAGTKAGTRPPVTVRYQLLR